MAGILPVGVLWRISLSSSMAFILATALLLRQKRKSVAIPALQSGYIGCNTGNGKKLSSNQAQLGQATCLADAKFLPISCVTSYVAAL